MKSTLSMSALLLLATAGCGAHRPPEVAFRAPVPTEEGPGIVQVIPLVTGEVQVDRGLLLDLAHPAMEGRENDEVWVPVIAYLVRHPTQGDLLIDSGFDSTFAASGHGNFGGLARFVDIARQPAGHDTSALLRQLGVEPESLKMILLSHMHADHTAGLPELPLEVPVVTGPSAITSYEVLWFAPHDHLAGREAIHSLSLEGGKRDLFGDGSLVVLATPGHAAGNLSFLVRTASGRTLLTCDASHTREGFDHGVKPGKSHDAEAAASSLELLRALVAGDPSIRVKAGHEATDWDLSRGIQDPL